MAGLVSDSARERELYRCFDPRPIIEEVQKTQSGPVSSSQDTALTAFAQLGALRFNARRAAITLCDRKHQYVLAEATQTLSLQSDTTHEDRDNVIWGQAVLGINEGPGCFVLGLADDRRGAASHAAATSPQDYVVATDLSLDERFNKFSSVDQVGGARFYIGVPIRSSRGINLGCYSIMDDHPRQIPSEQMIQFMRDIARTIMSHLETARYRREFRRGERMIRGLASFVDGDSTSRTWWRGRPEPLNSITGPSPPAEGHLNEQQQESHQRSYNLHASDRYGDDDKPKSFSWTRDEDDNDHNYPLFNGQQKPPPSASINGLTERKDPAEAPATSFNHNDLTNSKSADSQADINTNSLASEIQHTFSRAANIIREAIEVEGVIFFDASIASFGGLIERRKASPQGVSDHTESTGATSSSSDENHTHPPETSRKDSSDVSYAKVLGFATSGTSSINNDSPGETHLTMKESVLKALMKRHPHGKVFNFDESGSMSAGDSSEEELRAVTQGRVAIERQRSQDVNNTSASREKGKSSGSIINVFPGSRCIAMVPLRDARRKRWFAGALIWTRNPLRIITPEVDLSYLAAFGNSLMADVARLDAKFDDEAKGHLISSISHELRSPLHGILGSAEFLADRAKTQGEDLLLSNMIYTIETCGKTLLDTLDHLLDFAKISNLAKSQGDRTNGRGLRKRPADSSRRRTIGMNAFTSDVVLALIAEEVVEAVTAGYERSKLSDKDTLKLLQASSQRQEVKQRPRVIIDIPRSCGQTFSTQAGAWRRIIMNLFGNALKYTEKGSISVKLRTEPHPTKKMCSQIVLQVTDTGKGMSRLYLQERLFTPFAQEDSLSPGAGLGLSIVQKIVSALRGEIDVHSVHGSGTTVTVKAILRQVKDDPEPQNQFIPTTMLEHTRDRHVTFLGFHESIRKSTDTAESFDPIDKGSVAFFDILRRTCKEDLGMKISQSIEDDRVKDSDFCFATPEGASRYFLTVDEPEMISVGKEGLLSSKTSVIVICETPAAAAELQERHANANRSMVVEYVSQPCGPHKLVRVLAACSLRQSRRQDSSTHPSGRDPSSSSQPQPLQSLYSTASISTAVGQDWMPGQPTGQVTPPPRRNIHATSSEMLSRLNLRVLLVDDNDINLKLLQAFMKKSSYDHDTARDGKQAFEAFKASVPKFNLILMDISMPIMDGLEATRAIRGYERANKLDPSCIIALTGLESTDIREEAFGSGINVFLTKPIRFGLLTQTLEQAVTSSRDSPLGQ